MVNGSSTSPIAGNAPWERTTHRVVFAHILPRDQRQALGRRRGGNFVSASAEDIANDVTPRRTDEHQQVVHLLRGVQHDLTVSFHIIHFEAEAIMHGHRNDQPDRVEGIGEHAEEGKVPGPGAGLIGEEDEDRLGLPLLEGHFGHARPHPPHIAREGIGQQVLARPVELQLLGDERTRLKHIPRQPVNLAAVVALVVGHNEAQIIAARSDMKINDLVLQSGYGKAFAGFFDQVGVHPRVPYIAPYVRLDDTQSQQVCHGSPPYTTTWLLGRVARRVPPTFIICPPRRVREEIGDGRRLVGDALMGRGRATATPRPPRLPRPCPPAIRAAPH